MKWRAGLTATAVALSMFAATAPAARAAQSITSGRTVCTVESLAPRVAVTSKGRTLTGQARVWCTLTTTVSARVSVSELDVAPPAEQVVIPEAARSVSVRGSTAASPVWVTVATSTVTCPSTEVGNEEFRTNARITLGTVSSAYDRTVPTNDQFAC